jgi:hypothetical protein
VVPAGSLAHGLSCLAAILAARQAETPLIPPFKFSEPDLRALARQYAKLERFAFLILLGIIFLPLLLGRQIGTDLNLFR